MPDQTGTRSRKQSKAQQLFFESSRWEFSQKLNLWKMLPTYERLDGSKTFKIAISKIVLGGVSLAFSAFIFCILWSVLFDFKRVTFTDCEVKNYLPSISAAIGNYEPQRIVWRIAILLHLPVRLAITYIYGIYYKEHIRRNRRLVVHFAITLNVIENLALLSLSIWTSSENFEIHRNASVTFVMCSELYMVISYFLNKSERNLALKPIEKKSVKYKLYLFIINVLAFALTGYFYVRHNELCEPGVYTLFALFEYILVLTNMAYHMTAYWDFCGYNIIVDTKNGVYLSHL